MDPFEMLKNDHRTVSELFEKIESASGRAKLAGFKEVKKELDVHAQIEETIFYPALKNADETRAITLEAYEEHQVVKELLAELDDATKPSNQWTAKFTVLKENVEHHVDEEEGELFSKAKDVLTTEKAEALGDEMAREKKKLGVPVPTGAAKPGLFKTVANALFGANKAAKTGKKKAAKKSPRAVATKRASTKKAGSKKTAKRATKKAPPKAGTAKSPARKSVPKKAKSRAKAA
ncbi:MAG: hemerythrin domain-containing protein [Pyrinomonadaceae bacterium]